MAGFAPITRHDMVAPFPDMDGKQIEFSTTAYGQVIGEIVTAEDPGKRFGMRIQRIMGIDPQGGGRVDYTVASWNLTKEQIARIEKTGDEQVPFRLKLQ